MKNLTALTALILSLFAATPLYAAVSTTYSPTSISWKPTETYAWAYLRITGDNNFFHEQEFAAGSSITFPLAPNNVPDGAYTYELTLSKILPGQKDGSRQGDGGQETSVGQTVNPAVYSGPLKVSGGSLVQPLVGGTSDPDPSKTTDATSLIADNLYVQGSICVGFDCVDAESMGFDTIRLKENNTRIKFEDTSVAPFPSTDWQLTANDSASGGANRFSIEDITAATIPFTVTGGAPSNSIFVSSTGRLGFRTATPVLDIHMNTSDTPAIRLEQNSSGGFTPQTWDVAGNEANFFVRDFTSGSRLPFRIRPGAPTSSIDIAASGNVGIGTAAPSAAAHVLRSDGSTTPMLKLEQTSATSLGRNFISMINNGETRIRMDNGTSAWHLNSRANDFRIVAPLTSQQFVLTTAGNLTIAGTLTQGSSRSIKENIIPLDAQVILAEIAKLPLFTWHYKDSDSSDRHVGPVAEDFYAKFKLGADNKHIAPSDVAGIALAAAQALNSILMEKESQINALQKRLEKLETAIKIKPKHR